MTRVIVDVREPLEYKLGHVKGALNVPLSKLSNNPGMLSDIPKDSEIIMYCNSGNRSGRAIAILKHNGYTNLVNGINKQYVKNNYKN